MSPPRHQVAYAYNIRGWLTGLNNPYAPKATDLFSLSLHYERGFTPTYEQYNGNLTGQTWRGRDGVHRAYGYVYDPTSRLLQGDFVARTGGAANPGGAWTAEEDRYRLAFASYDDNGNILTLRRRGLLAAATRTAARQYGPVDELTYRYAGNRLQAVDDAVTTNQLPRPAGYEGAPTSLAGDFQEGGTRLGQEYLYDANGRLTQDRNKGITNIAYNHLSLPRLVRFGTGADSLVFRYSAAGQKVAKLVYQAGKPVQRTDYLGPYQYEQDSLRFFPHAEGRVLRAVNATSGAVTYQREYTLKDHLGNLRLAYRLGQVRTYAASLNLADAGQHRREAQQFDSLSVSAPIATATPRARSDGYAAKLNAGGAAPQPLGPLKQLAVQQGDTVTVTAPGLYPQATQHNFWFSLASFLTGLLQPAPSLPAPPDAVRRGGLPLLQVGVAAGLASVPQLSGGVPKGYVRLLVFDADSNLVSQQTQQLSSAALNNYESLRLQVVVPQNGYVSAYVGNESNVDVFFDDVTVEHRPGLQVQENQYDPWGLSLAGLDYSSSDSKESNKFGFNSKEKEQALGVNWNDYGARFYDAQLGRWPVVDALAQMQPSESPYAYVSNCPTSYSDVGGGFKIPAWMQIKYPTLYQLLMNTAPNIIFNPAAIQKIAEFTHLSPSRIKQDAQFGAGPELLPDPNLSAALAEHTQGSITLNEGLLDKLEQIARNGTEEDYRSLGFLLMVSIFHEYIHYGRFINNISSDISYSDYPNVSKGVIRGGEAGQNWEKHLFGITIAGDDDAETTTQTTARKYLIKHESGRSTPIPGTDVTKGLAPDKKPDSHHEPKRHKPKERKAGE